MRFLKLYKRVRGTFVFAVVLQQFNPRGNFMLLVMFAVKRPIDKFG